MERNGKMITDDKWMIEIYKKYTCHVVPAEPGFWYGMLINEHDKTRRVTEVVWSRIIAWKIYVDINNPSRHMAEPVTATDDESSTNEYVLRTPEGEVALPGDRRFADWEAAFAYLNSRE
jgi:hypothetical protein